MKFIQQYNSFLNESLDNLTLNNLYNSLKNLFKVKYNIKEVSTKDKGTIIKFIEKHLGNKFKFDLTTELYCFYDADFKSITTSCYCFYDTYFIKIYTENIDAVIASYNVDKDINFFKEFNIELDILSNKVNTFTKLETYDSFNKLKHLNFTFDLKNSCDKFKRNFQNLIMNIIGKKDVYSKFNKDGLLFFYKICFYKLLDIKINKNITFVQIKDFSIKVFFETIDDNFEFVQNHFISFILVNYFKSIAELYNHIDYHIIKNDLELIVDKNYLLKMLIQSYLYEDINHKNYIKILEDYLHYYNLTGKDFEYLMKIIESLEKGSKANSNTLHNNFDKYLKELKNILVHYNHPNSLDII